jgi:glucokinase
MGFENDQRVVLTLDAGGTNLVFSAIQANQSIVDPLTLAAHSDDLGQCLASLFEGFSLLLEQTGGKAVAISFAFPGPADYPNGIIGDLYNLPAFRGGVALGPWLSDRFGLPVFINNDGDLFAYGEAIAGFLPYVNHLLAESGSPKRYKNLLGVTLGTGFGGGIVRDGQLFEGDNSMAGDIWLLRHKNEENCNAEEGASIRSIRRVYAERAGLELESVPEPKEIYRIARQELPGDRQAALAAFGALGEVVGDALGNAMALIDGLVVVGGGLSGASAILLPRIVDEMNSTYVTMSKKRIPRLVPEAFNLEDEEQRSRFLKGDFRKIRVPGSDRVVEVDVSKRIGVGLSSLGTSQAVSLGAYSVALRALDRACGPNG